MPPQEEPKVPVTPSKQVFLSSSEDPVIASLKQEIIISRLKDVAITAEEPKKSLITSSDDAITPHKEAIASVQETLQEVLTPPKEAVITSPREFKKPLALITGSTGHLGTAFNLALPELGFDVVSIDILPSENTTFVGSITDRALVASIFSSYPIQHVIHTATLHKPHIETHTMQQFVDTNITGTLTLLEEAAKLGSQIKSFIFFSTTSAFGAALTSSPGNPAVWIDETVVPVPKNIYGATKVAAEDMCYLVHKQTKLPVIILRTSRFFSEEDDNEDRRNAIGDENLKVLEMSYRRVDMEDIVSAALCAMNKAREIKFDKFIISAPTPFLELPSVLAALDRNPAAVLAKYVPAVPTVFGGKGWKHLARIDRVYDSSKAVRELGWRPKYTIYRTIDMLLRGREWRSDLTFKVGQKGYHSVPTGVYTKG
ncbi:UDP-glucose 4-epimerase [Cladobotryum mycophilum]|uniref:UDP-glucose 4-epimerase n=1 Tax=Cladobotryum mycophilum TaxID=491253 RepID=A0ABR0SIY9_9HYPO